MHDNTQFPERSKHNLEYSKVRQDFKNGDVVLYKGTSFVSKLIRKFTKSEYSHSGIVSWWNDRVMVMEAVGKGVVATPLSRNVRKYQGDVDWYSCKNEIVDADRLRLVAFAQLGLGKEYDNKQLIIIAIRLIFKKPVDAVDRLRRRSRKLFCSYYVSSAYNSISIDLKEKTSDKFTTPDDIAKSPLLEKKGALKIFKK